MSSHIYNKAGKYVAICNNTRFDGHYTKVFDFPKEYADGESGAAWYFLNKVDFVSCVEAVYPVEIFRTKESLKDLILLCFELEVAEQNALPVLNKYCTENSLPFKNGVERYRVLRHAVLVKGEKLVVSYNPINSTYEILTDAELIEKKGVG